MAVNKIVMNTESGEKVLMDLTSDTVTPDTLAEGATAHDASGQKITGRMAAGGGSVSWNDLTDKPFEETASDTLVWDGTWGVLDETAGIFTKISDAVPTVDDVSNGISLSFGEVIEVPGEAIQSCFSADGFCSFEMLFVVVPHDNYVADFDGMDLLFPEAGIYTVIELPELTVTIPGYSGFTTIHKIDEKFLPTSDAVKQTILFVNKVDGINRIFKDLTCTEMLTTFELLQIAYERRRVIVDNGGRFNEAIEVNGNDGFILYCEWFNGSMVAEVAYTAEYTGT